MNNKIELKIEIQPEVESIDDFFIKKRNSKKITAESFIYLCFSQEDQLSVYPLCKILADNKIPYMITPLSEYNGWDGIKENLADIESSKQFLWVVSDNSHKDDYIADIIEYAKQIKDESSIIEYALDSPKESIGDLCSIIEKRLGLDPEGLFIKANELNETGNFDEAIKLYTKAANGGHSGAQAQIGICYYMGKGVVKNYDLAVSYFKKAAEQGEPTAQYYLGECYMNGDGLEKNNNKAFEYYQKASYQGNLDALTELGRCYYHGISLEGELPDGGWCLKLCQDYNKAVELFNKAAEQGHPKAQNYLGICYENGNGVKKDQGLAFKWYQRSAEQNDPNGQLNLGNCYYKGIGTPKDPLQAVIWYTRAKELGNDQAACNLGWCYEQGEGVMVQDDQMAAKCYLPAAINGFSQAQYNVGRIFDKYQKYSNAYEWYKKAADQGDVSAQCAIAQMYKCGRGVGCSYREAVIWLLKVSESDSKLANTELAKFRNEELCDIAYNFSKREDYKAYKLYLIAANRGYATAQANLGVFFQNGRGVPINLSEANKWYRKAAEQGIRAAQLYLASNLENGIGIKQNYLEALEWYKKATGGSIWQNERQMVAQAQYCIARFYENGYGVKKDIEEAISWYEKAAKQNYKDARGKADALIKENSLSSKIFKLFK